MRRNCSSGFAGIPGVVGVALAAVAISLFLAATGPAGARDLGYEIARAADPLSEERARADDPWNQPPADIELPSIDPRTGLTPDAVAEPVQPIDEDELVARLVQWVLLRDDDREQSFAEITEFVNRHPGWPRLGAIRNKAERAIGFEDSDEAVLAWFEKHSPRTVEGATAFAEALYRADRQEEATSIVRNAWVRFDMSRKDEQSFLSRFGRYLEPEQHRARLDRLLWDNRRSAAKRQMKKVSPEFRLLADARIAMMRRKRNADRFHAKIPPELAADQGLVYEWVRWNRRRENDDVAIAALLDYSGEITHRKRWWTERNMLARRALRDGDAATAYRLVSGHGLESGADFAEAEFLAGWIALRFLDDPGSALDHFTALYANVSTPISVSRAAYWAGRASEASGQDEIAREWYRKAARNPTVFYGQLAGQRLGIEPATEPLQEPAIVPGAEEAFYNSELVQAIRLLSSLRTEMAAAGDNPKKKKKQEIDPEKDPRAFLATLDESKALVPFLRHLARRSNDAGEWLLTARLARDSGRIDIAVYVARRAARKGVHLGDLAYPTTRTVPDVPPGPALLYALIRQESNFDAEAHSRAGARGLMQLMPATARRVARDLRVKGHSTARLTTDPLHNMVLGSAYLESMLGHYEGSMIMAVAAYNAGPHRVDKWVEEYGDPRTNLDDAIDWIESIPFSETRNYVQRVMEALPIYRRKLDDGQVAVLQPEDIAGRLPGYESAGEP